MDANFPTFSLFEPEQLDKPPSRPELNYRLKSIVLRLLGSSATFERDLNTHDRPAREGVELAAALLTPPTDASSPGRDPLHVLRSREKSYLT